MPRKPKHVPVIELGWVVRASVARGGGPDCDCFVSDERPVGLSRLQKARFFTDSDDAARAAHWQLGYAPEFAKKTDGVISLV